MKEYIKYCIISINVIFIYKAQTHAINTECFSAFISKNLAESSVYNINSAMVVMYKVIFNFSSIITQQIENSVNRITFLSPCSIFLKSIN